MNNYKIFHIVAGKANPNTMNGVNKVVDALATEQTKMGLDVTVVGVANNTIKRHYPIYNYILFKKHPLRIYCPKKVIKYLLGRSDKNTVFHFHSVFQLWYLPLIKALKHEGYTHIIYTPHGGLSDGAMKGFKKHLFFHLYESRILRESECVHILGTKTEDNLLIRNYAKKVVCIPNGITPIGKYEHIEIEPTIGFLGRISCYHKGLDILIPAFAKYKIQGGHARLVLAGDGPDVDKVKSMIMEYDLEDSVNMIGVVYDEEKWNFLKKCSAHIAPSRFEGIPTSCLESAAVGCVQLVDELTNLGEFIRRYKAGIVIGVPSVESLSRMLIEFDKIYANRKLYMEYRQNAIYMIEKELNWNCITKRVVGELYDK